MDILACFKALADNTRLRLLYLLWQHELNVNELVLILQMGQSRISRHLKILTDAGLLVFRREGLWVFYSVPTTGEAYDFLCTIIPLLENNPLFLEDKRLAKTMLEERLIKTQQFFNAIAEDWDKLSREILGKFNLATAVTRHMPPCTRAADLGCGTGNILETLLEQASSVIGVDGSPRMLEMARRRFSNCLSKVSLRIGDLAHLPLKDNEADFICLNMVLHHLVSPLDALIEARRVLTPNGLLVLSDFNKHRDERMRHEYGDHWLGFELDTLRDLLNRAGFFIKKTEFFPVERQLAVHLLVAAPQTI